MSSTEAAIGTRSAPQGGAAALDLPSPGVTGTAPPSPSTNTHGPRSGPEPDSDGASNVADRTALGQLEQCRAWLLTRFDDALDSLITRVDHTLFTLAQEAENDPLRPTYFDVMRELRLHADRLRSSSVAELSARLGATFAGQWLADIPPGGTDATIPSVLAVDAMANRMRLACKDNSVRPRRAVAGLLQAAGAVRRADADDTAVQLFRGDPLDPVMFCMSLHAAANALAYSATSRLIFLKLAERHLALELVALYDDLDAFLNELGVDALDAMGVTVGTEHPSDPMGSLKLSLRRLLDQSPLDDSITQSDPLASTLYELQRRLRHSLEDTGAPTEDAPRQILTALRETGLLSDQEQLTCLLLELAQSHLPSPLKALSALARLPLGLLNHTEPKWQQQAGHPARAWLAELARYPDGDNTVLMRQAIVRLLGPEPDWNGSTRLLREACDAAGSELAPGDAAQGTGASAGASSAAPDPAPDFDDRNGRSSIDDPGPKASQHKVIAGANERAGRDLALRLAGRQLGRTVTRFLEDNWRGLMVSAYVADGGVAGAGYNASLDTVEALIWSLEPKPDAAERTRLVKALPSLLHALEAGLEQLGMPDPERRALTAELAALHGAVVSGRPPNSVPTEPGAESAGRRGTGEVREAGAVLTEALARANVHLFKTARSKSGCQGMTCSAAVALLEWPHASIAHVGDARAYHLHDARLTRLTADHSVAEQLASQGVDATAPDTARHRVLTRVLGLENNVRAQLTHLTLSTNDRLLLCSDGLTDALTEKQVEQILATERDPDRAVAALLDAAVAIPAPDNTSVALIARHPDSAGAWQMARGSVKGTARQTNEDAVHCDIDAGVAMVCDGSGERAAGAIASGMVVYSVNEHLERTLRKASLSFEVPAAPSCPGAESGVNETRHGVAPGAPVLSSGAFTPRPAYKRLEGTEDCAQAELMPWDDPADDPADEQELFRHDAESVPSDTEPTYAERAIASLAN